MNLPDKIKAIVLTCDRYRAITEHMIFQYDRLWPDHPFVFHVPYQELGGVDTERVKYLKAPSDIKGTVLNLLTEIDDVRAERNALAHGLWYPSPETAQAQTVRWDRTEVIKTTVVTIGDLDDLLRRIEDIVRKLRVLAGQFGFAWR